MAQNMGARQAENRLCDDTFPAHDLAWGDALLMDMEKIILKEGEPPGNYNINELEYYGAMSGDISHGDMSFSLPDIRFLRR